MTAKRGFFVSACLAAALLASTVPAWAQFASTIEGTVFDPTGLVVPGAAVTLTNTDTGVTQTASSTAAGYYRFPALPTGLYTVKVEIQGFRTASQENIRLAAAETKTVNIRLEV